MWRAIIMDLTLKNSLCYSEVGLKSAYMAYIIHFYNKYLFIINRY